MGERNKRIGRRRKGRKGEESASGAGLGPSLAGLLSSLAVLGFLKARTHPCPLNILSKESFPVVSLFRAPC